MKVLVLCPGIFLQKWFGFIEALASIDGLELTLSTDTQSEKEIQQFKRLSENISKFTVLTKETFVGRYKLHGAFSFDASIVKTCKSGNFDVIHVIGECSYLYALQAIFMRKRNLVKIVTARAAQNVYKKFPFPFSKIEKYVFKNISAVFPIFEEQAKILEKKGYTGKAFYLPNGVDTDRFQKSSEVVEKVKSEYSLPTGKFIVGVVGDISKQKGFDYIFESVRLLKGGNVHFLIVGDIFFCQGRRKIVPVGRLKTGPLQI